jgi:ribosomal-protein-alanine N-acetyltransferase
MSAADPVTIRPGAPADLPQVIVIEREAFGDPWPESALREELACDWMRLGLVAAAGDEVVGYIMCWRLYDQLHVLNLAVRADVRQHGVGSRLLEAAMRAALDWGLAEITLEVRVSNAAARAFYDRHGFRVTGRRKGFYRDNREDALIMTRGLPCGDG